MSSYKVEKRILHGRMRIALYLRERAAVIAELNLAKRRMLCGVVKDSLPHLRMLPATHAQSRRTLAR